MSLPPVMPGHVNPLTRRSGSVSGEWATKYNWRLHSTGDCTTTQRYYGVQNGAGWGYAFGTGEGDGRGDGSKTYPNETTGLP